MWKIWRKNKVNNVEIKGEENKRKKREEKKTEEEAGVMI